MLYYHDEEGEDVLRNGERAFGARLVVCTYGLPPGPRRGCAGFMISVYDCAPRGRCRRKMLRQRPDRLAGRPVSGSGRARAPPVAVTAADRYSIARKPSCRPWAILVDFSQGLRRADGTTVRSGRRRVARRSPVCATTAHTPAAARPCTGSCGRGCRYALSPRHPSGQTFDCQSSVSPSRNRRATRQGTRLST
jgi:hypothetical protein